MILPLHPRTAHVIRDAGLVLPTGGGLRTVEPLGYLDMISLVSHARIVLTDSGGLQKEAFFLGRPCITLRDETEWVETVSGGGNVVAGTDPRKDPGRRRRAGTRSSPAASPNSRPRCGNPSATGPRRQKSSRKSSNS